VFTFFRGNAEEVLDALTDEYSKSFERLHAHGSHVNMSRWVSLSDLEALIANIGRTAHVATVSIASGVSSNGWVSGVGDQRRACAAMKLEWCEPLKRVPAEIAASAAHAWSQALPASIDRFTRGPLCTRAEELFALLRKLGRSEQIVIVESGSTELKLAVDVTQDSNGAALLGSELQFLAGEKGAIVRALADDHELSLRKAVKAVADFSFHLGPRELPALDTSAGKAVGQTAPSLGELEPSPKVAPHEWVAFWAKIPTDRLDSIARDWAAAVNSKLSDDQAQALVAAVKKLAQLCNLAEQERLDVILNIAG
jgi:hypothetical protein